MPWPNTIPPDLRKALDNTLGARSVGSAEVWGAVKEWLESHGAEAPEFPVEPSPPDPWDYMDQ